MSQWTHLLGIIRFDSTAYNIFPEPRGKMKLMAEIANQVHDAFQRGHRPSGSEGSFQIDTVITSRGPSVLITGDLRDFGKADLQKIAAFFTSSS